MGRGDGAGEGAHRIGRAGLRIHHPEGLEALRGGDLLALVGLDRLRMSAMGGPQAAAETATSWSSRLAAAPLSMAAVAMA